MIANNETAIATSLAQTKAVYDKLLSDVEKLSDDIRAASFIVEKGDTAYSVKFAVPDGKPALIYDEIEQEE